MAKLYDQRITAVGDVDRVIKMLGVDDIKAALTKTMRMLSAQDMVLSKIIELQCIHFL